MGIFFIILKCGGTLVKEQWSECGICDRDFLCDLINEKIIKLFSFAICFGLLD